MSTSNAKGFTLIELMVSMAIGLIVIGGATTVYVATVASSSTTLKMSKLNNELNTLMSVMVNDLRRAGFWADAAGNSPLDNPFQVLDNTALEVIDSIASDTQLAANTSTGGECLLYTYDANKDTSVDNGDIVGFRLNNGVVQMREKGDIAANTRHDSCADADDTWVDVTDGETVTVTTLDFKLDESECLNTAEPDGVDTDGANGIDDSAEYDCYTTIPTAGSGDVTVETRHVTITLAGELAGDSEIIATLTQDVRVRNDLVRER